MQKLPGITHLTYKIQIAELRTTVCDENLPVFFMPFAIIYFKHIFYDMTLQSFVVVTLWKL